MAYYNVYNVHMSKECSVYLIGSEPGTKKIGIATDVRRRLTQIQTGNPIRLEIFHTIRVESVEKAKEIEKACHIELQRFRQTGEWFDIDISFGIKTITEAANPQLKQRLNAEAKAKRIKELKETLSKNKMEGKFLSEEMTKTRKYLDELHDLWMVNLKEYGNLTDEIKSLGGEL